MSNATSVPATKDAITRFNNRVRLARASELALMGRTLEAEALLCLERHLPMSANELDLLARIHVKQGRYDQARKCWEDAARIGDCRALFEGRIKVLDDWFEYRHRMLLWRIKIGIWLVAVSLSIWVLVRIATPNTQ
jgi:hypothetical protein